MMRKHGWPRTYAELNVRICYHASKHATQAPHVKRVVIILQINQQLRALEVPVLQQKSKGQIRQGQEKVENAHVNYSHYSLLTEDGSF